MDLGLKGKVAMITGASKGLGRAMAKAFGEEGVRVSICARGEAQLKDAAAEFQKLGFEVLATAADVTKSADMTKWMNETVSRFGGVDILVNNAGGPPRGDFRDWNRDDWIKAVDANMLTPIFLIKAVIDGMIERKFGRIVNITSAWVKSPIP